MNNENSVEITNKDIGFLKTNRRWNRYSIELLRNAIKKGMIKMKELRYPPFEDDFTFFKRPNVVYEYTDKELMDLYLASKSVLYFAENFVHIESSQGIKKIELWDYQREMLKALATKKGVIIKASRQVGKCVLPHGYVVANDSVIADTQDLFMNTILCNINNGFVRMVARMLIKIRNKLVNVLYRIA